MNIILHHLNRPLCHPIALTLANGRTLWRDHQALVIGSEVQLYQGLIGASLDGYLLVALAHQLVKSRAIDQILEALDSVRVNPLAVAKGMQK